VVTEGLKKKSGAGGGNLGARRALGRAFNAGTMMAASSCTMTEQKGPLAEAGGSVLSPKHA